MAGRIEHRVREPLPGTEVVGVALQVSAVLVPRHLSRPGAVGIPGRRCDVLYRRRPGVVVQLVVLGPERLEDELGSLETERDLEVGRNELGHATNSRTSTQGEPGERLSPAPALGSVAGASGSSYLESMLRPAQWHRVRVALALSLVLIFAGIVIDSLFSASWALDDGLLLTAAAVIGVVLLRIRGRGQT